MARKNLQNMDLDIVLTKTCSSMDKVHYSGPLSVGRPQAKSGTSKASLFSQLPKDGFCLNKGFVCNDQQCQKARVLSCGEAIVPTLQSLTSEPALPEAEDS